MSHPLAESFGRTAERYELGRTEWPAEVVDALGLGPESVVVELGAGTGKLTRRLVDRAARVVAVEPLPEMRAVLERLVPAAEVVDARAEALPLPDRSADAVVAADAFHWFDLARALPEIRRVLRPTGILGVLVTEPDLPTEPSLESADEVFRRHPRPDTHPASRVEAGDWHSWFGATPRETVLRWEQELTREGIVASHASVSWVASLPENEREELLSELRAALADVTYRRFWRGRVLVFEYASIPEEAKG